MPSRFHHALRCVPRCHCNCDDSDSPVQPNRRPGSRPNRPRAKAPKQALRQPLPKNVGKLPAPAEPQPRDEGEEKEDRDKASMEVEDEDSMEYEDQEIIELVDVIRPLRRKVGVKSNVIEDKKDIVEDEKNIEDKKNIIEEKKNIVEDKKDIVGDKRHVEAKAEEYSDDGSSAAPLAGEFPPSPELSHTGNTPPMSEEDLKHEPSSDDKTSSPSLIYPADCPLNLSDTNSKKSSSDDDFYSILTKDSHTGITPEMSDANLDESQYVSFPESERSSLPVRMPSTDEEGYNAGDEDSFNFEPIDEEMYNDETEHEGSERHIRSFASHSSDRRRRRSLESQDRADAEYRDLHGSDGSSSSTKRRRLSSDVFVDIEQQKRKLGVPPSSREVYRYRIKGAKYQAWIDDPDAPGCSVRPATLTLEEMIDDAQPYPWVIEESNYQFEHLALRGGGVSSMNIARGGKNYHYTYLRRDPGPNSYQVNEYEHHVGRGILVAERIFRSDGPYWCEAARAQYSVDYNIDTLRHVAFVDITDEQTGPYIRYELYPRLGIKWLVAGRQDYYEFEHGSVEYQELLGTRLGVSMACLVLSSFPRGTMKITKIVTWSTATQPQMRFVIEPIIREPVAVATAA